MERLVQRYSALMYLLRIRKQANLLYQQLDKAQSSLQAVAAVEAVFPCCSLPCCSLQVPPQPLATPPMETLTNSLSVSRSVVHAVLTAAQQQVQDCLFSAPVQVDLTSWFLGCALWHTYGPGIARSLQGPAQCGWSVRNTMRMRMVCLPLCAPAPARLCHQQHSMRTRAFTTMHDAGHSHIFWCCCAGEPQPPEHPVNPVFLDKPPAPISFPAAAVWPHGRVCCGTTTHRVLQ